MVRKRRSVKVQRRPSGSGSRPRSHPARDLEEAESLLEDLAGPPSPRSSPGQPADALRGDLRARVQDWGADQMLQAFCGLASAIAGNLDQRSLVKQILEAAITTLGAQRGILFLGRGEDAGLVPVVALSITGEEIEAVEQVSKTILLRGQKGEVLITPDATHDPRLMDIPSVRVGEIRSVLCAPLISRGEPIGVIYLDAPSAARTIPPDAGRFLEAFARLGAVAVENARVHGDVVRENLRLRRRLESQEAFQQLLSLSPQMDLLRQRAALAAQVDAPILILGEPGTGKQMLARGIHEAGARALAPFVAYNCAAIPRELMEAVLFGHVRGAFPGAQRDMPGLLRAADRGVLYLGEIADLDPELQAKLLHSLDEGVVTPVGSRRECRIDVHLISAASRDIRADVRAGRFLEQLYYRISVLELQIPPLRERPADIPVLIEHFIEKHVADRDSRRRIHFTTEATGFLQGLAWRGNVRELESLVRRALLLTEHARVDLAAIKKLVTVPDDAWMPDAVPGAWPAAGRTGQVRPFVEQERELLREALIRAGGNKSKAARLLGLHRNTLLRRLRKLGVAAD
jgi:transcriptional regulator with GAF, ATPase, and Fis domain